MKASKAMWSCLSKPSYIMPHSTNASSSKLPTVRVLFSGGSGPLAAISASSDAAAGANPKALPRDWSLAA